MLYFIIRTWLICSQCIPCLLSVHNGKSWVMSKHFQTACQPITALSVPLPPYHSDKHKWGRSFCCCLFWTVSVCVTVLLWCFEEVMSVSLPHVCVSLYVCAREAGLASALAQCRLRWVIHTGSSLVTGGTSSSLLPSSVTISSSIQKPGALTSGCSSRVPCCLFLRWMGNLRCLGCAQTWRQKSVSLQTVSAIRSHKIWTWRFCLNYCSLFLGEIQTRQYFDNCETHLVTCKNRESYSSTL